MDELADWQEEWDLVLTHEHPVADSSRVTYLRAVTQLRAYLAVSHPQVQTLAAITPRQIGGFLRSFPASNTRRIRLKSLRLFFGYLLTQPDTGLRRNPAAAVDLPTEELPPVPVVSDDDLARLLRKTNGTSFVDRRDTLALRLLLDTGCRRGELVGVDLEHVNTALQEITLTKTKGGKRRIVPFGGKTSLALTKYLRVRAQHPAAGQPALLLSTRGARLTGGGLAEMLDRRCRGAGLAHVHPHQLRHSWANDMLAHGALETDVETLAGWSTPTMVRRYGRAVRDQRARDASRRLGRGDRV